MFGIGLAGSHINIHWSVQVTLTHKEITGPSCSGGSVSGSHAMVKKLHMQD